MIDWAFVDQIVGLAIEAHTDKLRAVLAQRAALYRTCASWSPLVRDIAAAREELERYARDHLFARILHGETFTLPNDVLAAACPLRDSLAVEDGWGGCAGCGTTLTDDDGELDAAHR